MLREFRVDNFKSLINVVFQPRNANLLTGRNNSGKTNLCQALRFVSGSSAFVLTDADAGRWQDVKRRESERSPANAGI